MNFSSTEFAYIGDAVYEVYIRRYLLNKGVRKVNLLQKEAVKFVSAKAQAMQLKKLVDENLLTEDELIIVKRARNAKTNSKPKNADIITYKHATGLEALIGFHHMNKNEARVKKIIEYIIGD